MAENTTNTTVPAPQAPPEAQVQASAAHTVTGASAELGELFGALAQAQGEVRSARASSVGVVGRESSQTTFSYADLAEIWEACRAALSKSGLALLQRARVRDGWVVIETILGHSSGQWIRSELPLPSCTSNGNPDMRPRTIGATISFGRRYGLAALVGVVQAEDEPEQAQQQRGGKQDQRHQQQRQQQQQAKPAPSTSAKPAAKPESKAEVPSGKTAPAPIAAEPPVDFDPDTGVVREPAPQEVFERQLSALTACTTAHELDQWSKRIAEMQFSSEQLEQLRRALRTKRGSLAQPAA